VILKKRVVLIVAIVVFAGLQLRLERVGEQFFESAWGQQMFRAD
jgi:hypothetical protein